MRGKVYSLGIYKVDDGYELHIYGTIDDIIWCETLEKLFEEIQKWEKELEVK